MLIPFDFIFSVGRAAHSHLLTPVTKGDMDMSNGEVLRSSEKPKF
jgi:hypothetical protein